MMEIDDNNHPENDGNLDVSNVNFISFLSDPLRGYAQTCFPSPITTNDDTPTPPPQQQQQLLDEFEISVRSHLLQLIEQLLSFQSSNDKTTTHQKDDNDTTALATLLQYLKDVSLLCLHIATVQPATTTSNITAIKKLPFLLIEDTIDSLPLTLIQRVWSSSSHPTLCISSYILSNNNNTTTNNILTTPQLFIPTSKFVLLRICNKLLRLLSNRDAHANFAGEIMMLLSKVFPLSERSAMNVLGGFNVRNVCSLESLEEFRERKGGGDKNNGSGNAVGYEFYTKFWGLQQVFTDPAGTILTSSSSARGGGAGKGDRVQAYEGFVKDVTDVLDALESTPIVHAVDAKQHQEKENEQEHVRHHKYLTSSQLLHLQLKDPTLRIHFLTQLLIILSYLATLPSTLLPTGVQSTAGADTSKLTAQIRQTQMKQLGLIEKRVQKLLSGATSGGGGNDASNTTTNSGKMWKSLQWILRDRESMWKNWKKAKCLPAMDRVATTTGTGGGAGITYTASGSDVQKLLLAGKKRKLEHTNTSTTSASGNDNLNIETLAKVTTEIKSSSQPSLTTFLDPYVEALDPENGIEGEYHPRNDKVYTWRGLRLMARDQEEDEGQLKRFGKLRRKDGDFEGIVRDIWMERGEEIPGGLGEDYYQEENEEEEVVAAAAAAGGKNDAEMDDVSVGSTQEEAISKKEEEKAKKKRMAEFEKAAMEVEEDILDETATTPKSGDTEKAAAAAAVDEGQKSNRSSYASLADAVAPVTKTEEPAKEDKKKDEKPAEAKTEKKVESKREEKRTENKDNGKDVKREDNGSRKDKTDSKSPDKGKNGGGRGKKEGGNGKKDGNKGSSTNNNRNNNNQNNKGSSDNKKNDSKQQSRSRAKFTPPQKVQQHQNKSEPQRDNSNSRGGGGGGGGGGNRRGGNDHRGNNMPPPPQSRGGNRDGRAHTPPNPGGPGPRGGDQRGGNNGPPRGGGGGGGGGGGPGRGWEPPAGKGNFHPGQGGGGGRGGGGGGRGGDRRRHGRSGSDPQRIQLIHDEPCSVGPSQQSFTPQLFIPTSKFVLLRICNKLLRLLSNRDAHANFAGELMMLLSKVFPLSERSAMNVLGGFNVRNVCALESLEEFRERGGNGNAVGYEFYTKFWGLQQVFTDPAGTILTSSSARGGAGKGKGDRVQAYEGFVKDVTDVLDALESTPIVHAVDAKKHPEEEQQEHVRHHKYLTSSQLLHLQLKDPTLRIHFLTQLLIILSYLATLPSTLLPTGVQSTAGADTSKLTAQIRQTQMKQLGLIEKRVQKLLSGAATSSAGGGVDGASSNTITNNGKMWKSLQWILRDRESMWKNWKKAKCLPAMDRVAAGTGTGGGAGITYTASGSDVQKLLSLAGKKRKLEHTNTSTTSASGNDNLNIETLAKVTTEIKSSSQPTLTTFLDPYVEALDPENGIEGEYHPRNDKVYTWRGLRLMARDQEEDEGQLKRFGKLRRKDGDFEGIVRDIWMERGEEIPGGLGEDYYQEENEEEEVVAAAAAAGGKNDAEMDDVSVGSTQEEAISKKEEEKAKKKRMAEFEKAAMEVEEDILDETATTPKSGDTEKAAAAAAVDEGQKSNRSSYASLADAVAPVTKTEEPAKEDKKKDEKPAEAKTEKKVESKREEKRTENKDNGKDVKREDNGSRKDKTDSKSPDKGKNGGGRGKKEGGNGKKDGNKGSSTNNNRNNNNQNNKGSSDNKKNDSKQQSRSRAKFTPPQKVQQHQNKSEPQRDNSNSRGGGGGGGGGGNRRGGNDRRGNNMPPPPQSRGGNRDGRAHTPPNPGGPGPRGGDQRGGNNGPPRGGGGGGGGGGGPGRGWEPPAGKGNFHPGQGGGGGRGGGGGGRGGDRRRHGRR